MIVRQSQHGNEQTIRSNGPEAAGEVAREQRAGWRAVDETRTSHTAHSLRNLRKRPPMIVYEKSRFFKSTNT
jgi:hypothetical protein